jgi:hypothetical protein
VYVPPESHEAVNSPHSGVILGVGHARGSAPPATWRMWAVRCARMRARGCTVGVCVCRSACVHVGALLA